MADRYIIVKAECTCRACPSQWDAWTDTGQYLYLRFRHSSGTVEMYSTDDWLETDEVGVLVASFGRGDGWDGEIGLDEFCARAGLVLALPPGATDVVPAAKLKAAFRAALLRGAHEHGLTEDETAVLVRPLEDVDD